MPTASNQPTFLDRLTELVGADKAAMLAAEFGGTTVYVPLPTQATPIGVSSVKAPSSSPTLHDFLLTAVEDVFRNELARLMAGAVICRSEHHHEWLATAQQVLAQRLSVLDWHASQKTTLTQPAQPPSAA